MNDSIKTRILNKHDTEVNWNNTPNFTPKPGELIIYDKDANYNYPRLKIGDGSTKVGLLPFIDKELKFNIEDIASRVKKINEDYITLSTTQTISGAKTFSNDVTTIQNKLQLTRASGTGHGRISFYNNDYKTWFEYMSNPVPGGCPTGGTPPTLGTVDNWARRSLIENTAGYGWVWEACSNSHTGTPNPVMALSAASGHLRMTGPIDYANTSGDSLTRHYVSAGGGYSTGSGRLGLKIVAIDQIDIQAGIGIDLTGLSYETCLSTGRKTDTTASYITFATHTNETTAYKRLGYFTASGAADPTVTFTVHGSIVADSAITATGNITSSGNVISNYLCTKTAAAESSTDTSIAMIASDGYLRKVPIPTAAEGVVLTGYQDSLLGKITNAGLQKLDFGSSQPEDSDYFISQYAGGGTSHPDFYRRPVSALWGYMNGKAASVYAKLASPNNMIHNSNEITWVPDSYNNYVWINYRSVGGTGKSTITGYKFGNANGTTNNVFVEANAFSLLQQANITYNSTDKCIEFTFA